MDVKNLDKELQSPAIQDDQIVDSISNIAESAFIINDECKDSRIVPCSEVNKMVLTRTDEKCVDEGIDSPLLTENVNVKSSDINFSDQGDTSLVESTKTLICDEKVQWKNPMSTMNVDNLENDFTSMSLNTKECSVNEEKEELAVPIHQTPPKHVQNLLDNVQNTPEQITSSTEPIERPVPFPCQEHHQKDDVTHSESNEEKNVPAEETPSKPLAWDLNLDEQLVTTPVLP